MVDDQALSIGSANTNPRSLYLYTELNVIIDSPETAKRFRHRLWSHNLGVSETMVATWTAPDFFSKWDAVAKSNERLKSTPDRMKGEGVLPEPVIRKGQWQFKPRACYELMEMVNCWNEQKTLSK
jgi:phosphatidylserine/phosphatidylglycerophosphate/cardiolipin synthase-like enzyme